MILACSDDRAWFVITTDPLAPDLCTGLVRNGRIDISAGGSKKQRCSIYSSCKGNLATMIIRSRALFRWTKGSSLAIVCRMIDPKLIDELTTRLSATMPSGIQALQADVAKNIRATLESGLAKLDLVTREEFEVQQAVL
ncbi:MAG: accessory factor UbiK family protein, partial [Candidatus Thiodiazotropha sp.]